MNEQAKRLCLCTMTTAACLWMSGAQAIEPPGPGTYVGKRCMAGTNNYEPTVECSRWLPEWCASVGQECNGCFPTHPNDLHKICSPSQNSSEACLSHGYAPNCGFQENRRCTANASGGFSCVWQSTTSLTCMRWSCDDVRPPQAE